MAKPMEKLFELILSDPKRVLASNVAIPCALRDLLILVLEAQ